MGSNGAAEMMDTEKVKISAKKMSIGAAILWSFLCLMFSPVAFLVAVMSTDSGSSVGLVIIPLICIFIWACPLIVIRLIYKKENYNAVRTMSKIAIIGLAGLLVINGVLVFRVLGIITKLVFNAGGYPSEILVLAEDSVPNGFIKKDMDNPLTLLNDDYYIQTYEQKTAGSELTRTISLEYQKQPCDYLDEEIDPSVKKIFSCKWKRCTIEKNEYGAENIFIEVVDAEKNSCVTIKFLADQLSDQFTDQQAMDIVRALERTK